MRLMQLQQLIALKEHGTISQAAQSLYVSQPSMSVSLRELETELGVQLIIRSNKGVCFTPVGQEVLSHAEKALMELESIRRLCDDAMLSGKIRIASTPHFCTSILVEVKLNMEQSYPAVSIELSENDSNRILTQVEKGDIDLGVIQLCDISEDTMKQKLESDAICYRSLFSEEMCIAVSEHHPLSKKQEIDVDELFKYPYGSYKSAMNTWVCQQAKDIPEYHGTFHVDDIAPLRILLIKSNAFTIIPLRSIVYGNQLFSNKMKPLTVKGVHLTSDIGMVFRKESSSKLLERLEAILEDQSEQYQMKY